MIYIEYNTNKNNKLDDLMIMGREKEEVRFINILWDLIERMVGGREFHMVGPEFLKAL